MAIRSGRFKVELTASSPPRAIIRSDKSVAFYRIFNSGDKTFTLDNGSGAPWDVAPTFSLDFSVNGTAAVSGSAGTVIEGIYEYLDNQIVGQALRSGRFNIKGPAAATHKIIDLAHKKPEQQAYYRIFNSGEIAFEVWEGQPGAGGSNQLATVEKEQSFDFEIASKRDIWVKGSGAIEGIYDFLGVRSESP